MRQVIHHEGRPAPLMLRASSRSSQIQMCHSFLWTLRLGPSGSPEGIVQRSHMIGRVVSSVLAMLAVAVIPTSLFAQSSDPNAAAVGVPDVVALRPVPGEQMLRLSVSGEGVRVGSPPPQRAASRDSLRNGAVIGAAVGAAVLGGLAATICHVHRERGGPSCVPDSLRLAAIGGAIGLGAGVAIDVARSSSQMVRLSIAF